MEQLHDLLVRLSCDWCIYCTFQSELQAPWTNHAAERAIGANENACQNQARSQILAKHAIWSDVGWYLQLLNLIPAYKPFCLSLSLISPTTFVAETTKTSSWLISSDGYNLNCRVPPSPCPSRRKAAGLFDDLRYLYVSLNWNKLSK